MKFILKAFLYVLGWVAFSALSVWISASGLIVPIGYLLIAGSVFMVGVFIRAWWLDSIARTEREYKNRQ